MTQAEYKADWYQRNKARLREKHRASLKAWRKANPQKYKDQQARYRSKYPEKTKLRCKLWREKSKEHCLNYARDYRNNNRDKLRALWRAWYHKHPEKVKSYVKQWLKKDTQKIGENYARRKLSRGTPITLSAWPIDLVQLKQAELKLKRLCRASRQTHNYETTSSKPMNRSRPTRAD